MQELILQQSLLVSVGALLFGLLFGLLLGRRSERGKLQGRIDEVQKKAREEAQLEKANLATELHVELDKVRDSIIKSAEAYQQAVHSIDSKLSPDSSRKEAIDINVRANLEAPEAPQSEAIEKETASKFTAKEPVDEPVSEEEECPSEGDTLRMSNEGLEAQASSEAAQNESDTDESDTLEQKAINDSDEGDLKKRA